MRSFFGIAIPLKNASSVPFSKSFFAGGSNDNRAWTAYDLGPGSSDNNNEFMSVTTLKEWIAQNSNKIGKK